MKLDHAPPPELALPGDGDGDGNGKARAAERNGKRGAALKAWIRALEAVRFMEQDPAATLCGLLDGLACRYGDAPALLGDGDRLSFRSLAARANQVARWAVAEGVAGQTVGLLMPNRPEYVAIWLGLSRAGCVVALLNTTLSCEALQHGLRAAGALALIVDGTLLATMAGAGAKLPSVEVWVYGDAASDSFPQFEPQHSGAALTQHELPTPKPAQVALLIYTSGTTGLPKGAKVTHGRILEWSLWFAGMMNVTPADRLYDCLPMYHSVGGVVSVGAMLVRGASILVSRRFSASRFWDEVVTGECTIVQYIGEICRYLAASPPHRQERAHRLRLACGNGLQASVWHAFQDRFAIPQILEFYAATEGNVSLYNCEGRPGAIGRVPPLLAHRFPVALIRSDPASLKPLRDPAGFCINCAPDETGEAIGRIDGEAVRRIDGEAVRRIDGEAVRRIDGEAVRRIDGEAVRRIDGEAIGRIDTQAGSPSRQFDGYTDIAASDQKVLRDVFVPGDRWFRTGDLMRKDAAGFYYFVDRIGDTFRWKGENVSTTEVTAVLQSCPGVADAVVYGVRVPGQEGRAGMAAVTAGAGFDLALIRSHLASALPDYAQPLFVRLCPSLDLTSTFKLARTRLATEAYAGAGDPVWFNDRAAMRFVPCDRALLADIETGRRRL